MRRAALREQFKADRVFHMWNRKSQIIGKNKKAIDSKTACRKKVDSDD